MPKHMFPKGWLCSPASRKFITLMFINIMDFNDSHDLPVDLAPEPITFHMIYESLGSGIPSVAKPYLSNGFLDPLDVS